jgi:hypothetical protein
MLKLNFCGSFHSALETVGPYYPSVIRIMTSNIYFCKPTVDDADLIFITRGSLIWEKSIILYSDEY